MTCETAFSGIADHVLSRLGSVSIEQDPFPHIVLKDAFPPDYYQQIIDSLPASDGFSQAEYPGTGRFTSRRGHRPPESQGEHHHGLVLRDWSAVPLLQPLHEFLQDDAFSRALLARFSDPDSRSGVPAIPLAKHSLFSGAVRDYCCVFELHKDLAGYEISPHPDNPAKIVTFLWYLQDDPVQPSGTILCRLKPGVDLRSLYASGAIVGWEQFDIVKEVCGPNVLFAFPPNEISFHAVKVPPASNGRRERTVVRGFIARKGLKDVTLIDTANGEPG